MSNFGVRFSALDKVNLQNLAGALTPYIIPILQKQLSITPSYELLNSSSNSTIVNSTSIGTTIIDTSNKSLTVTLPTNNVTTGTLKTVGLKYRNANPAYISTNSGSFILNSANPYRIFVFDGVNWAPLDLDGGSPEEQSEVFIPPFTAVDTKLGYDVSISAGGSAICGGAPGFTGQDGFVFMWNLFENNYIQNIIPTPIANVSNFGTSVSISSDGGVLSVGATNGTGSIGYNFAFILDTIPPFGYKSVDVMTGPTGFGYYNALSADGTTIVVGAPESSSIFIYSHITGASTWELNTSIQTGIEFGYSVAISSDASILAVGDPGYNSNIGCVYIYEQNNGIYNNTAILSGTGGNGQSRQGSSVSLSADGQTLASGAPFDGTGAGATWIFSKWNGISAGNWTQQGNKLVGSNQININSGFGVALSGSGNTLAIDGPNANNGTGTVWLFNRIGSVWQFLRQLTPSGNFIESGFSVALTSLGDKLIIGAPGTTSDNGALILFD